MTVAVAGAPRIEEAPGSAFESVSVSVSGSSASGSWVIGIWIVFEVWPVPGPPLLTFPVKVSVPFVFV